MKLLDDDQQALEQLYWVLTWALRIGCAFLVGCGFLALIAIGGLR